jgi:hypothetical protein
VLGYAKGKLISAHRYLNMLILEYCGSIGEYQNIYKHHKFQFSVFTITFDFTKAQKWLTLYKNPHKKLDKLLCNMTICANQ